MSTESKLPPDENARAAEALRAHFDTTLDRAARESTPPGFDEVAAYVDGTLDEIGREIFESRLEDDQGLRAEVEDLRALREAMRGTDEGDGEDEGSAPAARATSAASAAPAATGMSNVRPFPTPASRRHGRGGSRRVWTFLSAAAAVAALAGVTWLMVKPGFDGRHAPAGARTNASSATADGRTSVPPAPPVQAPSQTPARTPSPATDAIVALRDGGRVIGVDANGHVTGLAEDSPLPDGIVAQALSAGTLPKTSALAGLTQRELTLMGSGSGSGSGAGAGAGGRASASSDALAAIAPIATVVRTDRPTFRWTPRADARAYTVTIYSEDFEKVMSSPALRDTAWTATDALPRGRVYQWQVTADTPGGPVHAPAPPASDARFRVLDAASNSALDRDLARAGSSRLLAALLLARAGVMGDAEHALVALQAENAGDTRIARLLTELRAQRVKK